MKKTTEKVTKLVIMLTALLFVFLSLSSFVNNNKDEGSNIKNSSEDNTETEQKFSSQNLKTNTTRSSIDLAEILDGGPGKDGIPSINIPEFVSILESEKQGEQDDNFGIKIEIDNEVKFYPYSILVWHEIVNDAVRNQPVLVTFCPLCGTGIVYDPVVAGEKLNFGVSGKLWESNLLMYDNKTESLWSQSIGESVVGDFVGKKLEIIGSDLISFGEFKQKYPNGKVLSRETGYSRNYDNYPYGNYNSDERLYFPVSVQDKRFKAKELMYVVNFENKSVAFKRVDLLESNEINIEINNKNLNIEINGSEFNVTDNKGNKIPGYHEMWFSWSTHHQEDGIVWTKEDHVLKF